MDKIEAMSISTSKFPDSVSATKITYIDGRPATITLRRVRLVVVADGEMREHVFDKDVVTIGAMEDNDLVLDDETVSRNHCKIFLEGDQYMVSDLDSTNGTFVNRIRVREAFLRPDYIVTMGKTELRFAPVDENLRIIPSDKERYGDIIGRDPKMREIYAILEKIAPTDATVIVEGETGLLVEPGQPDRLADALRTLLDDEALRRRMGQAARARAQAEFSVETMARRYLALYAALRA